MLLLGIDLGTSFIKVSVVDAETRSCIASARNAESEAAIISNYPGWAEQNPETWWQAVKDAIKNLHATKKYDPSEIAAIGIAYQMHGLVMVDNKHQSLRDSIIWCDSRAVKHGNDAYADIGEEKCLNELYNSPGNFTASKLAWVKDHEPEVYQKCSKIMLPGDFISMKLTGEINTTRSALSEGILWDFEQNDIATSVLDYFDFGEDLIPDVHPVFSIHGLVTDDVAEELSLKRGIPVCYKAGDQLNNALSLNVMKPGEVAATAGTSGVIYAVTDHKVADRRGRVNSFAHVNHSSAETRLGVLLCINGCGIVYSWLRKLLSPNITYEEMNGYAAAIVPGSEGVMVFPFGNGAERMLGNKMPGAGFYGLDLNKHGQGAMIRATQEGIAYAFKYGLDVLFDNRMDVSLVRAGRSNLFLSDVFIEAFVNTTGISVELYENDGSVGAAIGAGIGCGAYSSSDEAFKNLKPLKRIDAEPMLYAKYQNIYYKWKRELLKQLNTAENAYLYKGENIFQ